MQAIQQQLRKIGITVRPTELSGFGALNAAAAQKQIGALVFTTNFGVPNLAKNQTLEPSGSLNYYGSTDETLTKLLAEASVLPLDKAEGAWQKVYGHVVELAWFAPVAAINATYITTKDIKAPRIGQSIVIDAMDVVPAN